MNRRSFFKALASVALVAATPLKFVAPQLHARVAASLTFSDLVAETLRRYGPMIAENVTRNNAILHKFGYTKPFTGGYPLTGEFIEGHLCYSEQPIRSPPRSTDDTEPQSP